MPVIAESGPTNPAGVPDIEARWRSLSTAETTVATALLSDAWAMLQSRLPALVDRIADGSLSPDLVVAVESAMVLRVLKNPDGKRQEAIDDYSWTIDSARSAGALYVTDDELRLLGGANTSGAFTITPAGSTPTAGSWTSPDVWTPLT